MLQASWSHTKPASRGTRCAATVTPQPISMSLYAPARQRRTVRGAGALPLPACLFGVFDDAADVVQKTGQAGRLLDGIFHLLNGRHDGGVVAAAKGVADLRQAQAQHFPAQIHGDLPGNGHVMAAAGALDVVHRNAVVRRNRVLNDVAGDASALAVVEQFPQSLPRQLHVDGPPGQRAVRR